MTTLARRLKARGHDVVFISAPDGKSIIDAAGIPFLPYCETEYPVGSGAESFRELSRLHGTEALAQVIRMVTERLEASFRHLPVVLRENRVDALVLDEVLTHLGLVPMHMGVPFVHISNALHNDLSGYTPSCFYDWPHETTPEALARNQEGLRQFAELAKSRQDVGHRYAEQVGLRIDWSYPYATTSKLAWLTQVPKEFDFPSAHWPQQFHHTGPLHDGLGRAEVEFPWERLTGDPLIYASMGTLQNGLEWVFSTIAEAVGERSGFQLVMSVGPAIDAKQIKNLPTHAVVVSYAPQIELLKRSRLCITHAGLNTTLESLTQGVPMVAIPVSIDQPGVAARIAYTKTGAFVPLQQLETRKLSELIEEVISVPEYRQNAVTLQEAIARTNGLEKAVDLLEVAFGITEEIRRDA
jgi:MGT family glycosyltransferase